MFNHLINLFYPDLCAGCGQPLATGNKAICVACRLELPYMKPNGLDENVVTRTFWGRVPVNYGFSLFYFQKHTVVQQLLHQLKYRSRTDVAEVFGHEIGNHFQTKNIQTEVDLIVPVPMHKSKLKTRGYNQSELLANAISVSMGKPVSVNLLKKQVASTSQTKMGRIERWKNAEEQFVFEGKEYAPRILLVDDVITTGATLEACANAILKERPGTQISIATLAYTYR